MTSHEQNLLPFSTPQSYALLSVESKTTQGADNKEMLDECHDIVWWSIEGVCVGGSGSSSWFGTKIAADLAIFESTL